MLPADDRPKFNAKLCELPRATFPDMEPGDTLFEYYVNEDNTEWAPWVDGARLGVPQVGGRPKFASLVIPTLDSERLEYALNLVSSVDGGAVRGSAGTAKTTTIKRSCLLRPRQDAQQAHHLLVAHHPGGVSNRRGEAAVEKTTGGSTFGPPTGKKLIVFVDDISMPQINDWGDQVTNEIVRQLLEQGGMYSLDKPIGDMKMIVDVYLAAMNTPGGGKNDIPNRLKRHFCIFNVPLPSVAAINNIFGQLVAGRFAADVFSPQGCGRRVQTGARHYRPVEQGADQDAADACQVPLPVQHARAQQGVPGPDPRRARQV